VPSQAGVDGAPRRCASFHDTQTQTCPNRPHVSFVIPVRNDARRLQVCVNSIKRARRDDVDIEILVADNGSTDNTAASAREAGARVLTLPGISVAEARNRAAREASGSILAFVDADHELDLSWILAAVESLASPEIVAVGAPYHAPEDGTWVQRMYDSFRQHGSSVAPVAWLGSGNLAVRRQAFVAVGGFDATLITCEDVDLCRRLRENGGLILHDPRLRTIHHGDPATLRALFFGELWRGRDNVRASLREFNLGGLPSLAIPAVDLLLLAVGTIGLLLAWHGGLWATALAVTGIGLLAALRASVMVTRLRTMSLVDAVRAMAVALTYDVARALAPIWSGSHAARRRAEGR
jgi:GT2 family glycosyltransferase